MQRELQDEHKLRDEYQKMALRELWDHPQFLLSQSDSNPFYRALMSISPLKTKKIGLIFSKEFNMQEETLNFLEKVLDLRHQVNPYSDHIEERKSYVT